MTPFSIRMTILVGAALWPCAGFAAGSAVPAVPDVDTSNGVAPIHASEAAPVPAPTPSAVSAAKVAPAPAQTTDVQRYCLNIAAAAAEARNAWQTKKLTELQADVAKAVADLEAREAALKEVIARRDEALKRADATLVSIFAKMKPDVAAGQLSALDDDLAAAVLQQLNARAASAILNEIPAERAARLVNTIAGTPPDGKKS